MLIRYASALLTVAGALALILGLLFWFGVASNLISMHMLLGFLTVGALWVIAIGQVLSPGGSWIIAIGALVVGALTVALGLYQSSILTGAAHWVVQVFHLLLGLLTIGLGHMAAARARRHDKNR